MKNKFTLVSIITAITLSAVLFLSTSNKSLTEREKYAQYLQNHPFNNHEREAFDLFEKEEEENETDRPNLAWEQDYLRTMDPSLGRPPQERLFNILSQLRSYGSVSNGPGSAVTPWVERGPNNVGGRTRALEWDPNDTNGLKVWAGGTTGGLWYNNNITLATSPWNSVNDFWNNIAITCIAFDPNNTQIMYVGTGEGFGTGASRGAGIWKSIDGGSSWNQLASTTGFYYVNDIKVRNESGTSVIYAAADGNYYNGIYHGATTAGLQRSTNGGTTWTQVLPVVPSMTINFVAADIEINSANRIWIGTKASPYGAGDRGGGRILYSDNGTTWTIAHSSPVTNGNGRVKLACAQSNSSVVYAVVENGGKTDTLKKTINAGANWTGITKPIDADNGIPTTDYSRGQAWYDLTLAVDPNNENNVIAGAVDNFRTTNGGTSWSQITKWSNNNNLAALPCSGVHADQHAVSYKPGSSTTLIMGNDGGVYYTPNIANAATADVFGMRNNNYNVTQFYACAIHPSANVNNYLAGAQDNGTQRFTGSGLSGTVDVTGGDGAYCFIDQTNPNYQITSYVYNSYYLSTNNGASFFVTLNSDQNTGKFINPADYDDNLHILYSNRATGAINRIRNITTTPTSAETVTIPGLADNVSHLRVSPYTVASTTLFLGTDAGSIWKVTSANGTPVATNITGSGMPTGSVSCIEIGASENELLVTYYNYGVTSVWYTSNGGTNWVSKEGNLPDMPVRWALFNPNNRSEVLLATELGVWATSTLNATTPTWATSNNGLANVRVDMLQMRSSDLQVTAATYGRGLFTSNGFAAATSPSAGFIANKLYPCLNETVQLTDTSIFYPTSWTWTISPSTFVFTGGTTASSQHPKIQFTAAGTYSITLNVSNVSGTNQVTQNSYIVAGGYTLPFTENWETTVNVNRWTIDNQDFDNTWAVSNVSGNGSSTKAMKMDNFSYTAAAGTINRDGLISPVIRLAGYGTATLTFKYAYKRRSTLVQDSLAVFVSTNCGTSWTRVASYSETQASSPFVFITNANSSSTFTPSSAADWCGNANYGACKTINLDAYAGSNIKIKFESISGNGNNLFIDDISLTGTANAPTPVANFISLNTSPCASNAVSLRDTSTNSPTTWQWTFTPSTVTFLSGTTANSQHPVVSFNASGNYTIKLKASNVSGSDSMTKTNYVNAVAAIVPTISIAANDTDICNAQNVTFTSSITGGGATPSYQWKVNNTNIGSNLNTFNSSTLANGDTVTCTLLSNATCALPTSVVSKRVKFVVHQKPTTTFTLSNKNTCQNDTGVIVAGGNPSGGIYSGSGLVGNVFKPISVASGSYPITYSYTDTFGCSNNAIDTFFVNANPSVTLNLTSKTFCNKDTTINLAGGSPIGGVYTGIGVASNQFKTSVSGAGVFPIKYTVTSAKGCVGNASDTITVNSLPTVSFVLATSNYCNSDTLISLSGGIPSGGIYNGNGINAGSFKPSLAGSGTHFLTYTYTDTKGCKNTAFDTMSVNSLPSVSFTLPLKNICYKDTTLNLTTGNPTGGIYSGVGVIGSQFKSSVSGVGNFPIKYTITDIKGCKNAAVDTININALPTSTFVLSNKNFCLFDTTVLLNAGSPAGGIYSGTGVVSNTFKPLVAGLGNTALTYTYTNAKGCSSKSVDTATVNALPVVSFTLGFNSLCLKDTTLNLLDGAPTGGVYSGTGVSNNQFKPSVSGSGSFVLSYKYTDTKGCSNKANDTMNVLAVPAKPTISVVGKVLTCSETGSSYEWYKDGVIQSSSNSKSYTISLNGTYKVRVFNTSGCFNESKDTLMLLGGLKDLASLKSLKIYPNPSSGNFNIDFNLLKETDLTFVITDLAGREVYKSEKRLESGHQLLNFKLNEIAKGSYLLRIYEGETQLQRQLIVE